MRGSASWQICHKNFLLTFVKTGACAGSTGVCDWDSCGKCAPEVMVRYEYLRQGPQVIRIVAVTVPVRFPSTLTYREHSSFPRRRRAWLRPEITDGTGGSSFVVRCSVGIVSKAGWP